MGQSFFFFFFAPSTILSVINVVKNVLLFFLFDLNFVIRLFEGVVLSPVYLNI